MTADRMLNLAQVRERAGGVSASTIYRWMGDNRFPKARRVGVTAVRWLESEVAEWQQSLNAYDDRDAA